jgi:threonine dehydrogenase-like Zn-dependent dehydrogenase
VALAVKDLEESLSSAKVQAHEVRREAKLLHQPKRAAVALGAGVVGLLVGVALLIIIAIAKDSLADPATAKLLMAPEDDETPSAEEEAQVAEAKAELARGETIDWDALRDELKTG